MRPELVLTGAGWLVGAALVVAIIVMMWRAMWRAFALLRRSFAVLRAAQGQRPGAMQPGRRSRLRWIWLAYASVPLSVAALQMLDPAHGVLYRRAWWALVTVFSVGFCAAMAIWSPRYIRTSELGFSLREGVRYHAPASRLLGYALLQGLVVVIAWGVLIGWYVAATVRQIHAPYTLELVTSAAMGLLVALWLTVRRAHGLDRRCRRWVYGADTDVPYPLWRSVRTSIAVAWGWASAGVLFVATAPGFIMGIK